jgi:hypothetical protein
MSIRTSFEFVSKRAEARRKIIRLHQNTRNPRLELFMSVDVTSESSESPDGGNLTRRPIASAFGSRHERDVEKFSINEDFLSAPSRGGMIRAGKADDKSSARTEV